MFEQVRAVESGDYNKQEVIEGLLTPRCLYLELHIGLC